MHVYMYYLETWTWTTLNQPVHTDSDSDRPLRQRLFKTLMNSGVARGGGGGAGPRAQALEGAPAQLVGANFKKKIRRRQISKVTSLQCAGLT